MYWSPVKLQYGHSTERCYDHFPCCRFSFNKMESQMNFGHHDESKRLLEDSMLSCDPLLRENGKRFPIVLGPT